MAINRLALTLGEPSGIGPDIAILAAQQKLPAEIIVIGSSELLVQRAKRLDLPLTLYEFDPAAPTKSNGQGHLAILPIPLNAPCIPGKLNNDNNLYVLKALEQGVALCLQKQCQALVTGPVHKAIIHQTHPGFCGHTEYLKALTHSKDVLMTFYTPSLIVGLVTTHCPLNQVTTQLTEKKLISAISILHHHLLTLFNKPAAKILILGLNPHAGESGLLGDEEQKMIIPTLNKLKEKGFSLEGPLPADTAFIPQHRQRVDAILAMYHDQGLAPLKALFFNDIVNITLGLPFLRTSVDHGTALDLAGTGRALPDSLLKAINAANQFCPIQ